MKKLTAYVAVVMIGIASAYAFAADSMNGTQISDKAIELTVTGNANIEVPNDKVQIHWTASAQEKACPGRDWLL